MPFSLPYAARVIFSFPEFKAFDFMDMSADCTGDKGDTTFEQTQTTSVDSMGSTSGCIKNSNEDRNKNENYVKVNKNQDPAQPDEITVRVIIDSQVKQIKQLEDKVKQLEEHRQALIEDKVQLQMELSDLKESSRELTEKMASLSSNDPRFENTNDDTSPSKIGKLSDGIFSDDWFRAYESLHKAGVNEREILECLSKIIEMCYKKCAHKSTSVIRQFLLLTETDDLPTYNKMHQLYQFRKSISHEKSRRQTVIDEISASVAQDLNIKDDTDTETTTEQQRHLRHFVSRCTELSWLAVTSSPPLTLELDVTDKDYKDLQIYFSQYSAGDHVFCDTKESLGKVAMVVWPALISEDNDVYNKGSVLVYDAEESHI